MYAYFSRDGQLLPIEQAAVPLDNIEYSYGYGVYETIRLANGKLYFLPEHCERLLQSAQIINLAHDFTADFAQKAVQELIENNQVATCNIKILLIGGPKPGLYMLCLNPLFPDRKLLKSGVSCTIYEYEREFPRAKTLNMLPSYLAYRDAKAAGAYEALLVNRRGHLTEGTRSNFFVMKDRTIISPPSAQILPGIMRSKVLQIAKSNSFEIIEQEIKPEDLSRYDGAFLTSATSKIMPISRIADRSLSLPEALLELMGLFDQFLAGYQ